MDSKVAQGSRWMNELMNESKKHCQTDYKDESFINSGLVLIISLAALFWLIHWFIHLDPWATFESIYGNSWLSQRVTKAWPCVTKCHTFVTFGHIFVTKSVTMSRVCDICHSHIVTSKNYHNWLQTRDKMSHCLKYIQKIRENQEISNIPFVLSPIPSVWLHSAFFQ